MKRIAVVVGILLLTFGAGVATGMKSVPFATDVNAGLVNALNSVGQNLFDSDAFGASVPPSPVQPVVQVDVVGAPMEVGGVEPQPFRKIINIVYPPDPANPECRIAIQLSLESDGTAIGVIDNSVTDFFPRFGTPTGTAFCQTPAREPPPDV